MERDWLVASLFNSLGLGYEDGLSLTFHSNLSQVHTKKALEMGELIDGVPRVLRTLEQTRAKCVVAETVAAFTLLDRRLAKDYENGATQSGTWVLGQYKPPWKFFAASGNKFLIARTPNHPSRMWKDLSVKFANLLGQLCKELLLDDNECG
jgi:hypothetical protein